MGPDHPKGARQTFVAQSGAPRVMAADQMAAAIALHCESAAAGQRVLAVPQSPVKNWAEGALFCCADVTVAGRGRFFLAPNPKLPKMNLF
jgi:hypothetical protein